MMCAVESDCLLSIDYLIKSGFDVTYQIDGSYAVDLLKKDSNAYNQIVLALLQANSPFPKEFNQEGLTKVLNHFINIMKQMHQAVEERNLDKIKEISEKNPRLRHFYLPNLDVDSQNMSAYRLAQKLDHQDVLEVFDQRNIFPGPFELKSNFEKIKGKEHKGSLLDIELGTIGGSLKDVEEGKPYLRFN